MKSRMPARICRTIASGAVKRPTPTTGFDVSCLMPLHQVLLRAFGLEARGAGAGLPRAVGEIPEVGQVAVHLDEIAHLGVGKAEVPSPRAATCAG